MTASKNRVRILCPAVAADAGVRVGVGWAAVSTVGCFVSSVPVLCARVDTGVWLATIDRELSRRSTSHHHLVPAMYNSNRTQRQQWMVKVGDVSRRIAFPYSSSLFFSLLFSSPAPHQSEASADNDFPHHHYHFCCISFVAMWSSTMLQNLDFQRFTWSQQAEGNANKLSCRKDTARCFVSLNSAISHSGSFKLTILRYLSPHFYSTL